LFHALGLEPQERLDPQGQRLDSQGQGLHLQPLTTCKLQAINQNAFIYVASESEALQTTGHTNSKLCGRPPQYAPAPCKLTFDLFDRESGV